VFMVAASDVTDDVTEQSEKDSVDVGFCGEPFADHGELLSSLSPLLFSMKLCGLYFDREVRHRRCTDNPEWNPATRTRISWSGLRIYATVALILVWLNVIRLFSLFDKDDHFSSDLLMKIILLAIFSVPALMYTACYYASHTGKLVAVRLTMSTVIIISMRRLMTKRVVYVYSVSDRGKRNECKRSQSRLR